MDASLLNLIGPAALGLIALGVGGVSFLAFRGFETASRRRARLAGGPAGATIVGECDQALDALQTVHDLTTRSARKRPRLMTPKHGAKRAGGDDRRNTVERRERRERPRRA